MVSRVGILVVLMVSLAFVGYAISDKEVKPTIKVKPCIPEIREGIAPDFYGNVQHFPTGVKSHSMLYCIDNVNNDLVRLGLANINYSDLVIGDIVTFNYSLTDKMRVHRIINKSGDCYITKGDDNKIADTEPMCEDNYEAVVVYLNHTNYTGGLSDGIVFEPKLEGVCRICAARYSLKPRNKWVGEAIESITKEMVDLKPKQRAIVDRTIQILQGMIVE